MNLRIEDVLESKGVSIAELARRVNVSRSSMHNTIKNGNPNIATLQGIANALGVTMSELIDGPKPGNFTCPNCGASLKLSAEITSK